VIRTGYGQSSNAFGKYSDRPWQAGARRPDRRDPGAGWLSSGSPAPTYLDPPRDQIRIRPGRDAVVGGGARPQLLNGSAVEADEKAGHLSQQVRTTIGYLPQLCYRGGRLRPGRLPPRRMPAGRAGKAGHGQLIGLGRGRIAHGDHPGRKRRPDPAAIRRSYLRPIEMTFIESLSNTLSIYASCETPGSLVRWWRVVRAGREPARFPDFAGGSGPAGGAQGGFPYTQSSHKPGTSQTFRPAIQKGDTGHTRPLRVDPRTGTRHTAPARRCPTAHRPHSGGASVGAVAGSGRTSVTTRVLSGGDGTAASAMLNVEATSTDGRGSAGMDMKLDVVLVPVAATGAL
jgi:hypothetical protein